MKWNFCANNLLASVQYCSSIGVHSYDAEFIAKPQSARNAIENQLAKIQTAKGTLLPILYATSESMSLYADHSHCIAETTTSILS